MALINGTQFITAIGVEALYRAEIVSKQADIIAALSIDALIGTPLAFDEDIHANRPHPGQQLVAARLRALLDISTSSGNMIRGEYLEVYVLSRYHNAVPAIELLSSLFVTPQLSSMHTLALPPRYM